MTDNNNLQELLTHGFRYAYSLSHDQAQAEDLLQSAWLAVFKANGPMNKPYLFTTIRNHFINQYRRNSLAPMVPLDEQVESADESKMLNDMEAIYADFSAVNKAMEKLRAVERESLYLFAVEGYTVDEVAQHLDTTRGTVLSLIHRARKKLKARLQELDCKVMP